MAFHVYWQGHTHDKDAFFYENLILKNSDQKEIFGVTIDRKLTFY